MQHLNINMTDDRDHASLAKHNVYTTPALVKERELQPRSTETEDLAAAPRALIQHTQQRATGPVSERWLQQSLLPRLSRRPYETIRYFQQRMTTDAVNMGAPTQDIATELARIPHPGPGRPSRFASNSGIGERLGETNIALHEYQEHPISPVAASLKSPPLHDTLTTSRNASMHQTESYAISPGSTIQNTEEEHMAAIELCLSSNHPSSANKRNEPFVREHFPASLSKRTHNIDIAHEHTENFGAVDENARGGRSHGLSRLNDHDENTFGMPIFSASHVAAEHNHLKACVSAGCRPFVSTPRPFRCAVHTLPNPAMPSFHSRPSVDQAEPQPSRANRHLERSLESGCWDIELSQVVRYKDAFLSTGQLWCHVPGCWEDAVELHNQRRM